MRARGRHRLGVTALALALLAGGRAEAEELSVFAAASLSEALAAIAPAFVQASGTQVVFNLGGSNDLARQIRAGAPADVFVSADAAQMELLVEAREVARADVVALLSNRLVVVVPARSATRVQTPADLLKLPRLALADPEAVPAGVYARTWLQSLGLWDALAARVVPLLNVRAALQAVAAENAPAGIVYRTDAAMSSAVRVAFEVPRDHGARITYLASALVRSRHARLARAFVEHLRAADATRIFEQQGFIALRGE